MHDLWIDVDVGPVLDADDTLVDEHLKAVDSCAASFLGLFEEDGFGRVVDTVSDNHASCDGGVVEVELFSHVGEEADGGCVDDDVDVLGDVVGGGPDVEHSFDGGLCVEQVDKDLATVCAAVDDGDVLCASKSDFNGDCTRCATCAEDDNLLARRVHRGLERLHEALAVGVFADPLVAAAHDGVDRADDFCRLAKAVEVINDRHLVRDGAVEADKVHRLCASHSTREVFGRYFKVDVTIVHLVVLVRSFNHCDGGVFSSGLCEGRGDARQKVDRSRHGETVCVGGWVTTGCVHVHAINEAEAEEKREKKRDKTRKRDKKNDQVRDKKNEQVRDKRAKTTTNKKQKSGITHKKQKKEKVQVENE